MTTTTMTMLCSYLSFIQVSGPDSPRSMALLSSSLSVLKSLCSHAYARDERSAKDWRKLLQSAMVTILRFANGNDAVQSSGPKISSCATTNGGNIVEEEDDYPGWFCLPRSSGMKAII